MPDSYTKLNQALKRLKGGHEQKSSIFIGSIISIFLIPVGLIFFFVPLYRIWKEVSKLGYYDWLILGASQELFLLSFSIFLGFIILRYASSGIISDFRIILLIRRLEKFNTLWRKSGSKVQGLDEILEGIETMHKLLLALPIMKKYAYTKDSRYLFIQKVAIEYFYEILTKLRSDLQIHLNKQRQALDSAKSEIISTIKGASELEQVSELQSARLDRQIEQFEELQRVLVKL